MIHLDVTHCYHLQLVHHSTLAGLLSVRRMPYKQPTQRGEHSHNGTDSRPDSL